jgi:hypothetical protein
MSASATLLALVLTAAPAPQRAQELAASGAWEELYLGFSAADPKGYPPAQRRAIAGPLLKGCEALATSDAVMAYSLAERSAAFDETAGALKCLARTALGTEQRGSAEEALRRGLKRFPKDGHFGLELGRLLLDDQDAPGAALALSKVPAKAPESAEAKLLLQKARGQSAEESEARQQAVAVERRMNGGTPSREGSRPAAAVEAVAGDEGSTRPASLTYESGVSSDGMRTRSNGRFVIKYFNNERDFGQRADYEGRIVSALDEAHGFTQRVLGEARQAPVDVILYTREEFRTHHGASAAQRIAGLYSENAIRINDAAELTRQTKATLVHEYVHAAVDDFCGGRDHNLPTWLNEGLAEFVEWRYLGTDGPPPAMAAELRGALKAGQLPSLTQMAGGMLINMGDPQLAYATSGSAVQELVRQGGTGKLLTLIRAVGAGTSFEAALQTHYGKSVSKLEDEVKSALSKR